MEKYQIDDEVSVEQVFYTDPGLVIDVSTSGCTVTVKMDHGEIIVFTYCEKSDRFIRAGLNVFESIESDYLVPGRTKAVNIAKANNYPVE